MPLSPLRRLLAPVALLVAAMVLRPRLPDFDPLYLQFLPWLPYAALGIALLLAAHSNRARLFSTGLLLLAVFWIIDTELQVSLAGDDPRLVYSLIGLAIPVAVLVLLLVPERGLFNRFGLLLVAFVPALVAVGSVIRAWLPGVGSAILTAMPILPVEGYYLSPVASVAFTAAFLPGIVLLLRRDSETDAALVSALMFSFVALAWFNLPRVSTVVFAAAAVALINSVMRAAFELAYRDELTGLPSRRALNERLKLLGKRYVIAMVDVDHFKQFNDTYGHDVGDDVLKMVATRIARVRGGGKAYRFGGEEFAILFPGKRLEQCLPHLEAVRETIGRYPLTPRDLRTRPRSRREGVHRRGRARRGEAVTVTVSIGAAERSSRQPAAAAVLEAADGALYRAKANGRNCLVH